MSASFNRLFVDVSYTRTQKGSIGVTRTVRSLLGEFEQSGLPCQPVAIHSSGFRKASLPPARPLAGTPPEKEGRVTNLLRWMTGGWVRRLALICLPVALQQSVWAIYSRWTFDALSRQAPFVDFQPGDVLFMSDASWHYESSQAIQRARQQGARMVLMVHDLIPLRHPEYGAPLISLVFQEWLKRMLHNADTVICNSQATESDLKDYVASAKWSLPPTGNFRLGSDRVCQPGVYLPRPIITDFFREPAACFAAVGSFEPRKNYAWLLQVFEGLWAKGHDVRLLIAGRPTADGQKLIEKMKQHPEQGHRLLTIFDANDQELEYFYAHARALLFPSLAEGFGLPLVEARTRGCLVIASNLPAFQELADEGVSLFPENSIENIEKLILVNMQMGQLRKVAPMPAFTWHDSAQQCLCVMTDLLINKPA